MDRKPWSSKGESEHKYVFPRSQRCVSLIMTPFPSLVKNAHGLEPFPSRL